MRKHEIEVLLDEASPEAVWEAVTTAEGIMSWFAPECKVTPGEGGSITIGWGPGCEGTAPIRVWEPGKRMGWVEGEGSENPKVVEFQIEPAAGGSGGTTLRLVHSGFGEGASFDQEYESTFGGWHTFFAMLRYRLAKFPGVPAKNVAIMTMSTKSKMEAWEKFQQLSGITSTVEGTDYAATIGPMELRGQVVRNPKAGYLCLSVATLQNSLLGVFFEGGAQAMITFEWVLYGEAVVSEHEAEVRAALDAVTKEICG
jgi:uncharacterized protein YndB with AHSA1/START domain